MDRTKVIFRKWPNGDIIALFPEQPSDYAGLLCDSYMHVGQHGAAAYGVVVARTEPASPEEYADLKAELEADPYRYVLDVRERYTQEMQAERFRRVKEMRSIP